MQPVSTAIYRICRSILQCATGFYFSRIERFHSDRVPAIGPVLFTSNHPNSLTDAFVIGLSVPRKVSFVATVQLFRFKPLAWVLKHCGVIAINRVKDDPRGMRSVLGTFEACYRVLEAGEGVLIFPEGLTHDDPQLKTVKTGAARMALELEQRHSGQLGLQIVPVGLTFSAKERYRSEVLVNFGAPIRVSDWLPAGEQGRHESIQRLTAEIEHRIESLILNLKQLERGRLIQAVKRLYLDRLQVGNRVIHEPVPPRAGELLLTQAIARAVDFTCDHNPDRAEHFSRRLQHYEYCLKRLNLSGEEMAQLSRAPAWRSLLTILWGVALLPVALYGWLHRLLPYAVVQYGVKRLAHLEENKTHVSTTTILVGSVSFGSFFGAYIIVFHHLFGLPAAIWYALSLPLTSLLAHYYLRGFQRFLASLRYAWIRLRAPSVTERLCRWRAELVEEIEAARRLVPEESVAADPNLPL